MFGATTLRLVGGLHSGSSVGANYQAAESRREANQPPIVPPTMRPVLDRINNAEKPDARASPKAMSKTAATTPTPAPLGIRCEDAPLATQKPPSRQNRNPEIGPTHAPRRSANGLAASKPDGPKMLTSSTRTATPNISAVTTAITIRLQHNFIKWLALLPPTAIIRGRRRRPSASLASQFTEPRLGR
jgi:hypothetical protein